MKNEKSIDLSVAYIYVYWFRKNSWIRREKPQFTIMKFSVDIDLAREIYGTVWDKVIEAMNWTVFPFKVFNAQLVH